MIKYKDSGVEWIGQIPEDWNVDRLKKVLKERNEKNVPIKTENILSLTNNRGVIPYSEKGAIGNNAKEDLTGYKLAYPNDLVLNSMNVVIGSVGISKYFGAVSPVYYMLNLRNKNESIEFYNYIFQTKEFQKYLKGFGNGILDIRMRIPMVNLNSVKIPIVSVEKQHKIVEFLDKKCTQIDELIKLQEQEIEKLFNYRYSKKREILFGTNLKCKKIDSGIDWIGQIPAHWKVSRLKYIVNCLDGQRVPIDASLRTSGSIPYWGAGSIMDYVDDFIFDEEIILLGEDGAPFFDIKRPVAFLINEKVWVNNHIHVLKPKDEIDAEFLVEFLNIVNYASYINGSILSKLTQSNMNEINILFPPKNEQKEIVEIIKNFDKDCENLIKVKQEKITKLQNYKKSLIYEYVTGKKRCI